MTNMLEFHKVKKSYGKRIAVNQLDISVRKGSCFGLLGPNGAGKSTMMKLISGIIQPDSGQIKVMGLDMKENIVKIQQKIGYVPQSITLYEELSAIDNLRFFGELAGVKGKELQDRIQDVLTKTGLSDRGKDEVRTYSGGMKRRINIAVALLHKPDLLILDEPTVGIDPQSRNLIFELIRTLHKQGMTIIYSTHYMEEVEALCDEIAIVDNGNVIAMGELDELLTKHTKPSVYIESAQICEQPKVPTATNVIEKGNGWVIETEELLPTIQYLTEIAAIQKLDVKKLEILHPSLEDVFLKLTGVSLRDV
ncbi:ABC transporter ATP-binding protein [Shimazuella sp. AN120528]|uniref:ABC transporter ATP-binding protein n=1 Tax=Shimazuella soli TaxID=1892854 RepID=UPI001F113EFD|nr:ABC transporter ATP-binding protein [Shimazuella soli]MCH5583870.1 ABC transporter ATP-binding protein [Shimazuella soli]